MRSRAGRVARTLSIGTTLGLALLLLSGCVRAGSSASDPRLQGTWHLASGSDKGHGLAIGGRAITLTIGDAAHTGGHEPCSSYRATVTGGVGAIFVRAILTSGTRDSCTTPALTGLTQAYITALTASRFAAISQGALVFSSPSSNLVFLRTAPAPVADIRNTSWSLYAVGSQVPAIAANPAVDPVHLSFNGSDGITLSSPCVTAIAEYQLEGENLATTHTISSPVSGIGCTHADRTLVAGAIFVFAGSLLLDVSSDGKGSVPMLVVTNLDDNLPIVFRADN